MIQGFLSQTAAAERRRAEGAMRGMEQREWTAGEQGALLDRVGVAAGRLLLEEDYPLLWANGRFCAALGCTQAEVPSRVRSLGRLYGEYPADFAVIEAELAEMLKNGAQSAAWTCRAPGGDGGAAWLRMTATLDGGRADGCPVFYLVLTDVSELAASCGERDRYFRMMMDEYAGNVYICDMDSYELLYVNREAASTLKRTSEEVCGRKCYEVIQGRTSPCPFCTNDRLTHDAWYEWQFDNPVLERTFMIKNRIVNWHGHRARIELSHDMYSAEYKLAQKDRERAALLRTIPGGLARLDARDMSTILWYGADFLEMIGYTAEQFERELHSQCGYVHPDDLERMLDGLRGIRETGQHLVYEVRLIRRSGEQRIVTITLCYVSGEESWDGIPSFYTIGLDVTEERTEQGRQRRALEEAYQAARVANSAKTDFLSSMSHDIRTPMNAIMGMTAIARANLSAPDRVRDCLGKIDVSGRHLLSLINEVLDMSKIESGKIDLSPEDIDLPKLLEGVYDMCKPLVAEKGQELKVIVGQVRHEKIVADGDRLRQVFMNLLSNAVKYTPDGGKITLVIREKESSIPGKGQFEFVFTDNGIGMAPDYLPHIFEPFTRAEDSRISKIQGTGLGMAITENIIHMMNGTIDVESELGKGSRFTVTVPLQYHAEEVARDDELAGLSVLVVDDDQIVCENAAMLLDELGMRGQWVLSGAEALERVALAHERGDGYFAVILDWKMPGMDGLETVKAIRGELGEDVPIIIISAYDYSDIEDEFLSAGADAFITKPLFKSKMLHVLQLFCESGRPEDAGDWEEEPASGLLGKRMLLVEDNDLNREIAAELLQMQGVTVECAENGARAVELFGASAPWYYNAILMDIQMPVMNGYDATAAIRAMDREDAERVPIVALTANAFVSDISKARSVGMNDHIPKPIDMALLVQVLRRWTL